jgi:chromosome segregation ATPase
MFVMVATLCGASFTLGSAASGGYQDASGIPSEHPVMLALHYEHELALTSNQIKGISTLKDQMSKEFAPLHQQAEAIQQQMQQLQQSGSADLENAARLKKEGDALGTQMQPLFERYAQEVAKLLTEDQRQKLMTYSDAAGHPSNDQAFLLNTIMQSREQLKITPQQFTKLQYLLADFIRAFAPVREQMEILQLQVQAKFAKDGQPPSPDYKEHAKDLQDRVATLQSQFSEQAKTDVLEPEQRTKLEELVHGEHRSAPVGG